LKNFVQNVKIVPDMETTFISTSEARKSLGNLVSQAKFQGKRFSIGRHGKAEALLVPADDQETPAQSGAHFDQPPKQAIATIARKYNLDLIVLFGSHARGSARADSDIDIAVKPHKPLTPHKEEAFYHDLAGLLKKDSIDVINLDTHEDVVLRYQIFVYGKPLYEARSGSFAGLRMAAYFDYHDFAPFMQNSEKAILERLDSLTSKP
jgi:predicted nucleotidyltransferase